FVEKVSDPDRRKDYLRVRIDIEQKVKRRNDIATIRMMYGTIETAEGEVLRLDTRTQAGGQDLRAHGDVIGGPMILMLETGGQRQTQVIPWGPEVRGPYAPEQSMARKPLKEGEQRALRMFIPELNKIGDILLKAGKIEPVALGDGSTRPLLRVDQKT